VRNESNQTGRMTMQVPLPHGLLISIGRTAVIAN